MWSLDIETGPDFSLPVEPPPPFDEDAVLEKLYRKYRKEDTVARHLEEARDKWRDDLADWDTKSREEWPLDPARGEVVGCSFCDAGTDQVHVRYKGQEVKGEFLPLEEADLVEKCFSVYGHCSKRGLRIVGHNIKAFDLPFLTIRAAKLGIKIPSGWCRWDRNWFNFNPLFLDTGELYRMGRHPAMCRWDFETVSMAMGTMGKPRGTTGADIWKLLKAGKYAQAIAYMEQDALQPVQWVRRWSAVLGPDFVSVDEELHPNRTQSVGRTA